MAAGPVEAAGAVPVVSDDSRVERDVGISIFATQAAGFSAVLKHRRVSEPRWLLACDRVQPNALRTHARRAVHQVE